MIQVETQIQEGVYRYCCTQDDFTKVYYVQEEEIQTWKSEQEYLEKVIGFAFSLAYTSNLFKQKK